tara:strand:+ start:3503 stop:4147 length:645 start_codon:yes stop_codon:yes gene_type:complete
MRALFIFALILIGSFGLKAQKFRPYHAFGFEINANSTKLIKEANFISSFGSSNADFDEPVLRFDVLFSFDYGLKKWLGLSTGLGFSLRGGKGGSYRVGYLEQSYRRDLLYLSLPLRMQLKPFNFLWFEPGLEINTYLWRSHEVFAYGSFTNLQEDFKPICVNYTASARFHLHQGLSLHLGIIRGLSPVYTGPFVYDDFGLRFGLRFMFNQPVSK